MSAATDRDRDPFGRPRNARPRDALGRPLRHDATAADGTVEPVREDVERTAEQALGEAQRLLDEGRAFSAHEVLEAQWKATAGPERELWRGLAQICVGVTHVQRGNLAGGARLLRRGAAHVAGFAGRDAYGIDVARVIGYAETLARHPRAPLAPLRLR